jgi:hypothetical protein
MDIIDALWRLVDISIHTANLWNRLLTTNTKIHLLVSSDATGDTRIIGS